MTDIPTLQRRVLTDDDGFWGPKSQRACRDRLRALAPKVSPWPDAKAASLQRFYGAAGDEDNLVPIVPPFEIRYDGDPVSYIRVHKKCAQSLLRVLNLAFQRYGLGSPVVAALQEFGGCYCFRNKTGGSSPSLHAYGAAVDFSPSSNVYRDSWPMKATMPFELMECFAVEGWVSAGAFWGYDAMHFEATKI